MEFVRLLDRIINFEKLRNEVIELVKEKSSDSNQIILQGLDPDVEEWHIGTGSIEELEEKEEKKYHHLNSSLIGTELGNIINQYRGFRARIMIMPPRRCYSIHADPTARIHIPIITNNQCWMIWPHNNKCFKLSSGKIYYTDTRIQHTFINGGTEDRIHIVMCVDS